MAASSPALLFTSDSGSQFSPKLDGGVCSLEGMSEEVELGESAIHDVTLANDGDGRRELLATNTTQNTPHHNHSHNLNRNHNLTPPSQLRRSSSVPSDSGDNDDSAYATSPRAASHTYHITHIHASGLSNHSDGGVLAAETLTDVSPSLGPPPAPPEYDSGHVYVSAVRQPTPTLSQVASASGINLRENALACPLIAVASEFTDGLIPVEIVGAITGLESTVGLAVEPRMQTESTAGQPAQSPSSGQASPASTIEPWPPLSPGGAVVRRPSAASIGLPGEEVAFQGELQVGECKEDGVLFIWQNQLSRDFRIQWHAGSGKETMWMRPSTAQIVPVYAHAHSSPLRVYLCDTNGTQTPVFEFSTPDELFKFQASLTGERVVLDVSCAKWMRVNKPNGDSSAETFTGIRVQIWHETRKPTLPRRMSADSRASTASTDGLSGPRRDRIIPQQSRLVVFLGQTGGFLTLPITDDVEMEERSQNLVKLKARRHGGLSRRRSQPGMRARVVSPADQRGLPFHNTTLDNANKYEYYKNCDIEFETEDTKKEFVSVWGEVVENRRKQRAKIEKINEEMGRQTFTGRQAIRQWF